ncbi:efflux RND transporter periplasmic adaptor subunit [Marichromatium gracile]|uniref:efflux RND transporter periplasmic adaptor subunit n=1 Tax=Marichromatium gracile TaxID=1048 RepID=UPI001F22583E|nr:efflux RND transporter periplasmic adaptor subunit [Marichromatium gracile]MCF1182322.1 efflux RND transporter periplasmic adaptor subunit [Marichromatium gracile]
MNPSPTPRWRRLLLFPPIMLGVLILVLMVRGREPPALTEPVEPVRAVRVVEATLVALAPTAAGYGSVQPERVWAAVSQVAGRVVWVHPRLREGEIHAAGSELLRIDPVDYELLLAQARAELADLEVQRGNAEALLVIERRNLELAEAALARNQRLIGQGTTSQSVVDDSERALLASRAEVRRLDNTLALIPARRALLEAKARRAERDLAHTRITAPFELRVADLAVEAEQYVGVGQRLFVGDTVERMEIEAQVPLASLRRLFLDRPAVEVDVTRLGELVASITGIEARVRLDLGNHVAEWAAEFVRFDDTVDPRTRTMGVVVAVDRPFDKIRPGYRPPLSKNMFVEVVLRARPAGEQLVVPRLAVRNGTVLVADAEDRLRRRPVEVRYTQGELSVIAAGLEPGARVVVSDLVPVVEGMRLAVEPDERLTRMLRAQAVQP